MAVLKWAHTHWRCFSNSHNKSFGIPDLPRLMKTHRLFIICCRSVRLASLNDHKAIFEFTAAAAKCRKRWKVCFRVRVWFLVGCSGLLAGSSLDGYVRSCWIGRLDREDEGLFRALLFFWWALMESQTAKMFILAFNNCSIWWLWPPGIHFFWHYMKF